MNEWEIPWSRFSNAFALFPLLSPSVSSPAHVASANSTRISNGASRSLLVVADKLINP